VTIVQASLPAHDPIGTRSPIVSTIQQRLYAFRVM
jgi:hypothetical protein